MNAPDIARALAREIKDWPWAHESFQVLGPVNADSTSFVMIGTYHGDDLPGAVYRVSVERVQ